jgi:hypothetical protein
MQDAGYRLPSRGLFSESYLHRVSENPLRERLGGSPLWMTQTAESRDTNSDEVFQNRPARIIVCYMARTYRVAGKGSVFRWPKRQSAD